MNEPCMCGATDCPECFEQPDVIGPDENGDGVEDWSYYNDPTLGDGYDTPVGWP